jgi:hypothetical protein
VGCRGSLQNTTRRTALNSRFAEVGNGLRAMQIGWHTL